MKCYFKDLFWKRPFEAGGIWYRNSYTNVYFNLRFLVPEGFSLLEQSRRSVVFDRLIKACPLEAAAGMALTYAEEFVLVGPSGKAFFFFSLQDEPQSLPFSELFFAEDWEKAPKEKTAGIALGDVDFSLERVQFSDWQFHLYHGLVGKHSFNVLCVLEDCGEARQEYVQILSGFDKAVYLSVPEGKEEVPDEKMKEALQREYRELLMASKIGLEPEEEWKEPLPPKEDYDFMQYTYFREEN